MVRQVTPEQTTFPAAHQVARLTQRVERENGKVSEETVYLLTSHTAETLPAAEFMAAKRNYWNIESGLHYRLDVSALEDHSKVRNRNAALVLAMFRRLTVSMFFDWAGNVKNVRQATLKGFFDFMRADQSRRAISLACSQKPNWKSIRRGGN